jgi:ABC-type multidrug transport system permease subunit
MIDFKEFGKWLLDIAKYVLTAGIISTFFHGIEEKWLFFAVGSAFAALLVCAGMYFIYKSKP